MNNSLLIAMREWRARVGSRSFILLSIIGPIVILALIFALFAFGGEGKQRWKILIADPANLLDNRILTSENNNVEYFFVNDYINVEEFRDAKKLQEFDAVIVLNEKILGNKTGKAYYREKPSERMQTRMQYHVERRMEEVMVDNFTNFSILDYRKIKQPLGLSFFDVYDPHNKASNLTGWVGFVYGALIVIFIFLFGMTILRSITNEKSNRIVEVLLASVSPNQMLTGKIIGIGLAALVQFVIWTLIIGAGLYLMRDTLFPDMLDPANFNIKELTIEASNQSYEEKYFAAREYNEFVELIYNGMRYDVIIPFFVLFFLAGYLFYGALFAGIGASMGTESDGQQFVMPLIFLLGLSLYSGYYYVHYPESSLATFFHYLPFTSPVVVMVKLAQGYEPGHAHEIYVSFVILIVSALALLAISARVYKNGILQFGHRVRLKHLLKWLRKS